MGFAQSCLGAPCSAPRQSILFAPWQLCLQRQVSYCRELHALCSLPQEDVDAFFRSHEVMGQERINTREDEDRVVDWYRVLNHFCALGSVEKMYIAPVLDASLGNVENQKLFECGMARSLHAGPGKVLLDLGCGKGRVAHEVATFSGARVVGLNYDMSQVDSAMQFARVYGLLGTQLDFVHGSFNDHLPFECESFDGAYEVGAFCYAISKRALFSEIFRVLKPGARFSYCDWCRLRYNPEDPHHRDLLRQVKPLTGMVEMPFPHEVESAFTETGFHVEFSGEASVCSEPLAAVVQSTERSFRFAEQLIFASDHLGITPERVRMTWERIREGGQALQAAVELQLFSMTWQIIVRKPEPASAVEASGHMPH